MGISCTPPRQPGQLPPHTDDIMFTNFSGANIGEVKCTFTDTTQNPDQVAEVTFAVNRRDIYRKRLTMLNPPIVINANQVKVEVRYTAGAPSPDFQLDLGPLTGEDVRCVMMGLHRVFPGPTPNDIMYSEMIKGTGHGEAID